MAVVLGTSSGFVIVAPTADPTGGVNTTIDGSSVVTKHTSLVGANAITEIGWYRGAGTNTANFEIALYSEVGGVASARLFVDNTNSSAVQGWVVTAVNWAISENTAYWLAVQMDAHSGSSTIDSESSGGAGIDVQTSQTTLNDPYGGGVVSDADGMMAIYAKVSVARNISAGVGALTLTGFAPVVFATDNKNILADVGALSFSGFAPTVSVTNNKNVSAGVGSLDVSGFAPSVVATANRNITADVGSILISGFSPSVFATDAKNVLADTGLINITGLAPTIQTPRNILADVGSLSVVGFAPVVSTPKNIQADTGVLNVTGFAPSIQLPVNVQADKGQLNFTGFEPSVTVGDAIEIQAGLGQLTIDGFAPIVSTSVNIQPGLGVIEITGFSPIVETPVNILAGTGQVSFNGFSPTVSISGGSVLVEADFGEMVFIGYAPLVEALRKEFFNTGSGIGNGNLNSEMSNGNYQTRVRTVKKLKSRIDVI